LGKQFLTIVCLVAVASTMARAQNAAADDQTHRSALVPLLGKWTCTDTGSSKPYAAIVTSEGAWIVWRDNGEDRNVLYIGWNQSMKAYVVANVAQEGVEVSTTTDVDPLNATWHVRFPEHTSGPLFSVTYSERTFSLARPYVSHSGKPAVARLLCKKEQV